MASTSAAEGSASADEPPPFSVTKKFQPPNFSRLGSGVSINEMQRPRKLRLIVAANGSRDVAWAQTIAVRLSKDPQITVKAIVDDMTHRLAQEIVCYQNKTFNTGDAGAFSKETEALHSKAYELVEWADLLVLAPITADNLAKMIHGIADTFLLEVLRSWDTSKRILLVPGMSIHEWENPVTKKQMSKLYRKYTWVRVLPAIQWHYDMTESPTKAQPKKIVQWNGLNEVLSVIKNQSDLLSLGHDVDTTTQNQFDTTVGEHGTRSGFRRLAKLPSELWSIIFEYAGDWELAQACGVYTQLPMPTQQGWRPEPRNPNDPVSVFQHELEWTLLSANTQAICKKLSEAPECFRELSALATKLIFKFTLIDALRYIEKNCPHMFKCFDGKTIPTKASAYFPRTEILDWWLTSPSFLEKQYDAEAVDVASKHGYVHILRWWARSGLPIKYTHTSLEQASARGHIDVLDWWRTTYRESKDEMELKPGKSILAAAQYGSLDVIRWWVGSGLRFAHEEQVCKQASRYGQVGVLELWRELKGDDKITFDIQILTEPTLYSHIGVLDWWVKYSHGELPGMDGRRAKKVEYRMMDIEEALEDAFGDQTNIRRWWAEHGLNLGIGTTAWMTPREL
ncbi:hypothetical protein M406DRAFT_49714 [Cryphonectria parasitica EP155]|uniref:Flavoprotein domain-containing protein n=1 Tax=Cryphonectria parasitica (strain ATCC 38755 / EP155) TaxID=660469 RepID=A0A9P4XVK7_CRYP1|nr:uncharacterized protein M406DRAFT_49714 [Cryphonectria parasitica EP155]KAF3761607.1 hypothetical protein M406DRAFT_49714 [Cryphonectria parasitica EP155]